jgi:hypothetical protein
MTHMEMPVLNAFPFTSWLVKPLPTGIVDVGADDTKNPEGERDSHGRTPE